MNRIDLKEYEDDFMPSGLAEFIAAIKEMLAQDDQILVMDGDEPLCYNVSPAWMRANGLLSPPQGL